MAVALHPPSLLQAIPFPVSMCVMCECFSCFFFQTPFPSLSVVQTCRLVTLAVKSRVVRSWRKIKGRFYRPTSRHQASERRRIRGRETKRYVRRLPNPWIKGFENRFKRGFACREREMCVSVFVCVKCVKRKDRRRRGGSVVWLVNNQMQFMSSFTAFRQSSSSPSQGLSFPLSLGLEEQESKLNTHSQATSFVTTLVWCSRDRHSLSALHSLCARLHWNGRTV